MELPVFEIPIMHEESFYPLPQNGACGEVSPFDFCYNNPNRWVPFLDYENELDNPVEDKYRTLAHDLLRGLVDPALKPDREQRDRLAAIIASPSHHPSREDKGTYPKASRHDSHLLKIKSQCRPNLSCQQICCGDSALAWSTIGEH